MSIPVIALTPEQVERIAPLREKLRWFKSQSGLLGQAQKEKQEELDNLLHQVALSNIQYREWGERKSIDIRQSYRYFPTISEDGHSVVICKERDR